MCGGCGAAAQVDGFSGLITGPAERATVRAVAQWLITAAGGRSRVSVTPGGWTVGSPTGGTRVARTLGALWSAAAVGLTADRLPTLDALTRSPAASATHRSSGNGSTALGPSGRVAVLLGRPTARDRRWSGRLVTVDTVADLRPALLEVTSTRGLLTGTPTAVVRRGPGPDWCDDLDGLDTGSAGPEVLDGRPDADAPTVALPAVVAATWFAATVALGRSDGTRRQLICGPPEEPVVLDAVDGIALGARRRPPPTGGGSAHAGIGLPGA